MLGDHIAGSELKEEPAAHRQNCQIIELTEQRNEIRRQIEKAQRVGGRSQQRQAGRQADAAVEEQRRKEPDPSRQRHAEPADIPASIPRQRQGK